MRVGLLTVPFNNNYGGFLQAFALKKTIESFGHNVILVVRKRDRTPLPLSVRLKNLIKRMLGMHVDPYGDKRDKALSVNTLPFQRKYLMPQTKPVYRSKDAKKFLKYKIDCFVVGSDQVWRYEYANDSVTSFFCDFLNGTKTPYFSYAASFGTAEDEYPENLKRECAKLLRGFCAVSVRESSGIDIIRNAFNCPDISVRQTLDPTLLCGEEVYLRLIGEANLSLEMKPHIFRYILDDGEDKILVEERIKNTLALPIVSMMSLGQGVTEPIPSVEEWLRNIATADFVYTDSYHGMVFSVIFHKDFIVYGNRERGLDRFASFLRMLGLEDRMILSSGDFSASLSGRIDWDAVNCKLSVLRDESLAFLRNNLV